MSLASNIALEKIIAPRLGSIDPSLFPNETFDLYSIPAFDKGVPEILEGNKIGSSKQIVQPGDVLLSRIVPHIRRAWIVGEKQGRRIIASGEWIVFRGESFEPRYLKYVLTGDSFHAEFMRTVSGIGGSLLRARPSYVGKIRIHLPSLSEQQRIADILEKADALRAKRRATLVMLDTLTQSIFLEMFGDPATNPKRWPIVELKDCTEKIQIGPFGSLLHQEDYITGGIPLVNPKHIQNGVIVVGEQESITLQKYTRLSPYHLRGGDVVMGRRGEMGRCAIVDMTSGPLLCGTGSLYIRPDNKYTNSLYLWATLSSDSVKSKLERLSLGQTLPNLNSRIVEHLEIPVAPIKRQNDFVRRVDAINSLRMIQKKSSCHFQYLFTSLQHRAFRGEM